MFMSFYGELDADENLTFDKEETIDCLEKFARNKDLLGTKKVKKVIEHVGVDASDGLMSLFKQGVQTTAFPTEVYEDFFDSLVHEGQEYI